MWAGLLLTLLIALALAAGLWLLLAWLTLD